MFFITCKTTFKNLVRTATFWLIIIIMFLVAVNHATGACYAVYISEYDEVIMDTDPRFILEYQRYIIHIANSLTTILNYAVPILAVVCTILIAQRDYGDHFFEIEKSTGARYAKYVLGRILTLIVIVFFFATLCSFFSLHLYVFLRSGVSEIGLWEYLTDSTIRLLRANVLLTLPCITVYITLTYCVATIFKTSIAAAITGLGYALANMILSIYSLTAESFYLNFLAPVPLKIMQYLYYYDTEWFGTVPILETSVTNVILSLSYLAFVSAVFTAISYFRIRKRTI